jgi:hypothetical protein
MVILLGATAQDFAFNSHLYSIVVALSTFFPDIGAEVAPVAQFPSRSL